MKYQISTTAELLQMLGLFPERWNQAVKQERFDCCATLVVI